MSEFTKAMTEYRLGYSKDEIQDLFDLFDVNKDGTLSYDEFLRAIQVN